MLDDNINEKYKKVKQDLDKVSSTFCIAKWKEVTIHLDTGRTHSCHHPATHKISVEELKTNHTALHNTSYKKEQRKLMLEGGRPQECDYCWRVEDNNINSDIFSYSERVAKSSSEWAKGTIEEIVKKGWDNNTIPTSMEINFGSTCNLKCSYCNPVVSSKWMEEIKQYGGYKLNDFIYNDLTWFKETDQIPILNKDYNPYTEAFWKWWPELVKELRIFRITGGEPLLNKNTFKVLDYLIENPQPNLNFSINTNLSVPDSVINEFIKKMQIIQDNKCISDFKLYTSCEAHGKKAEYIRFGLNYDKWIKNCEKIIRDIPKSRLGIMSTYNILSITSFKQLLEDLLILKNKYTIQPIRPHTVSVDIPYLRWPEFMSPWLIPSEFLIYIEETITWMYHNLQQTYWPPLCGKGFFDYEIKRMERIYNLCRESINNSTQLNIEKNRKNLIKFLNEHDKRRGTNFIQTFPELEKFYKTYNI